MTQLENLKNQIKELEKSCDEARDRIKNENLPFLNIYENRAAFFINKIEVVNVSDLGIRFCIIFEDEKELAITVSDYIENIALHFKPGAFPALSSYRTHSGAFIQMHLDNSYLGAVDNRYGHGSGTDYTGSMQMAYHDRLWLY